MNENVEFFISELSSQAPSDFIVKIQNQNHSSPVTCHLAGTCQGVTRPPRAKLR